MKVNIRQETTINASEMSSTSATQYMAGSDIRKREPAEGYILS